MNSYAQQLATHLAERLLDRLADSKLRPATALNLSADAGATSTRLAALYPDISLPPSSPPPLLTSLVLANLTLATTPEPETFFANVMEALEPDGTFLATALGPTTFTELFSLLPSSPSHPLTSTPLQLADVQTYGSLLQRQKFALPVIDKDTITLTFATLSQLTETLSPLFPLPALPTDTEALETAYRKAHPRPDNRLPLTLELIYLHGLKPHPKQQKPLKPGQGKTSLVRILSPEN